MRVIVLTTFDMEDIELVTPVDILFRAGAQVDLVSVTSELVLPLKYGITIKAEKLLSDLSDEDVLSYDMMILPGGMNSAITFKNTERIQELIHQFVVREKLLGAICASTMAIASAIRHFNLEEKTLAIYPGLEEKLKGLPSADSKVHRDGHIITAKGPYQAMEFGFMLAEALFGREKVVSIKKALLAL